MEVSEPERLIRAVQQYPILYNGTVLGNKEMRLRRWKEVALILNPNWETLPELEKEKYIQKIQTRWRSLRDSFTRALRSVQPQDASGLHWKRKKFTYFNQLEFLKPFIQKSKYSSDEFGESSVLGAAKFESLESYQDMEVNLLDLKTERDNEASNDVMETQYSLSEPPEIEADLNEGYTNEKIGQILERLMYNQTNNVDNNSADKRGNKLFLLSLLPFMENLSDGDNMEVRMKIMGVLKPYIDSSNG